MYVLLGRSGCNKSRALAGHTTVLLYLETDKFKQRLIPQTLNRADIIRTKESEGREIEDKTE